MQGRSQYQILALTPCLHVKFARKIAYPEKKRIVPEKCG
jgi:hypothetical protein